MAETYYNNTWITAEMMEQSELDPMNYLKQRAETNLYEAGARIGSVQHVLRDMEKKEDYDYWMGGQDISYNPKPPARYWLRSTGVGKENKSGTALELLIIMLIEEGHLIPVSVFGGDPDDEEAWGYGLMDTFTKRNEVGSDCNRAANYLLRPSDELMTSGVLVALQLEDDSQRPTKTLPNQED